MITPGNLLLTTVIVVLVMGTKKLRNVGSDLGTAVKNFRDALNGKNESPAQQDQSNVAVDPSQTLSEVKSPSKNIE